MKTRTAIAAVMAALVTAGSFAAALATDPPMLVEGPPAEARANDLFALTAYSQLARGKGNVFFSPCSIHTALAMTYAGAQNATADQMYAALGFWGSDKPVGGGKSGQPGDARVRPAQEKTHVAYKAFLAQLKPGAGAGYQLTVANALWGQKGFPWRAEFLKATKDNYGAGLQEVDFAAAPEPSRNTINAWVEEKTQQKIKDLVPEGVVTSDTRLVLTNAVYFKGTWAAPFDTQATQEAPFHLGDGKDVQAPLMYRQDRYGYAEAEGLQALSMPYKGDELSMVVLLPKAVDGLAALEKDIVSGKLASHLAALQTRKVEVFLPRFKMTCQFRLEEPLAAMGMKDAFDPGKADFSGMAGKKDLFISAVVHKAFVEVNEEGTEAAAATGVAISLTSEEVDPNPVFRADHPFLFLIRHNATGAILFMGRLCDPAK